MAVERENGIIAPLVHEGQASNIDVWENMYAMLSQYVEREGHCNVPQYHREDGSNLGTWFGTQRVAKRKGKLRADRERDLEGLGIVWDPSDAQWEANFDLLKTYLLREGHCNVPQRHIEDRVNLGTWLNVNRQAQKKGKMTADHERRLEDLGIAWDLLEAQWEAFFTLLETYVKRKGHCHVPKLHKEDGANLGAWLKRQREKTKKGELRADRESRLGKLGVVWDNR
jgi:hypothetical protein